MKTYQDRHWSKGLPLEHCSSNPMEHDDPHVALGPWPGQGQRTHVLVCSLLWFPARGVLRGPEGLFRLNWPADQPHPGGQPLASPQGLDEKQGLKESLSCFKISLPGFWLKTEPGKEKVLRKGRWVRSNMVNSNSHSMPTQKPGPDPRVSGPPQYRTQGQAGKQKP